MYFKSQLYSGVLPKLKSENPNEVVKSRMFTSTLSEFSPLPTAAIAQQTEPSLNKSINNITMVSLMRVGLQIKNNNNNNCELC